MNDEKDRLNDAFEEAAGRDLKYRLENLKRGLQLAQDRDDEAIITFDKLIDVVGDTATEKGFWSEPEMMDKYVAKLALIHSEVTEILEALRKSQGSDKVTEEFADVFIRCFDLYDKLVKAGLADPGLEEVIVKKAEINALRPPKHGHVWG